MEDEMSKEHLNSTLKYRVTGTGPKAEAHHGRYTRTVLRYMRARRPVQWLIATENITRPHAPGKDRKGSAGRDSESADEHTDSGTGSDGDQAETDHLNAIRRQLFPDSDLVSIATDAENKQDASQDLPSTSGEGNALLHNGVAAGRSGSNGIPTPLPTHSGTTAADDISGATAADDISGAEAAEEKEEDMATMTNTQLAARASSKRNRTRDGRFAVKEEVPSGADRDEERAREELAPNNADGPTASAINDAYERGLRDRERTRSGQDTALAVHLSELMELQHRRQLRNREKQRERP